ERFYELLKRTGITTLTQPSGYYGLSLILGGGENSMWELSGVYASLARTLNHYTKYNGRYDKQDMHMPVVIPSKESKEPVKWISLPEDNFLGAGALYCTFNAMQELMRPGEELLWTQFSSSKKIAWKTG